MKGAHLALAGALAAALFACGLPEGDHFGKIPKDLDPTHLRWCNSGEPEFVDPALATDTASTPLLRLMFSGLGEYGIDFKGSTEPALATDWEVSEDLRTFTFHLRKDAVWSNGRPITSADFAYHVARILHPKTISRNTTPLMPLKNAARFNAGTVKMLLADAGPFEKGDIVEVVGLDGEVSDKPASLPSSNIRVATKDLQLRDLGAPESEAYSVVPAGTEVDVVELGGPNESWAYVYCSCNNWVYGWVPLTDLDVQPQGELGYTVREVPPEHRPGVTLPPDPGFQPRQATVKGKHLLTVPEVLGVRTPDPHTFVVETWGPMPYLLDNMKSRIFRPTPRESVSRSPKRWTYPDSGLLVTSGPFTMTYWFERDKMEYVKSPTYFDADKVKLERFTVFNIDDQAASTNYYMQGRCDAVTPNAIPYSYLPALSGEKRGGDAYDDFYMKPYLGIYYYVINTEKVQSVHLRRAMNYAVDRRPLPNLLHGGQVPTSQFIPGRKISTLSDEELAICGVTRDTPGVAMFVEPELCYVPPPGLDFDPQKAKEELALAKKELGAKFPKELTIKYNIGSEGHKIVAEYLQNQLALNLGMKVNLATQEWKTYLKDTVAGNFEVARMGWIGSVPDPESEFLLVFKCGSPYNRSRWCNDEYDRLFKEAETKIDRRERLDILKKAEAILYDEVPMIPLYVYTQQVLIKPYVKDMAITFGNNTPLHRAWIDPNWRDSKAESGR